MKNNPCIRCGKQRVVINVSEEHISGSMVQTTEMSCPDPECQKMVDNKFEKERVERQKLKDSTYKVRTHWTKKKKDDE